jgi:hypothetical protein
MSADIYLQCFEHGKPKTFRREIFEEIVVRNAVAPQFATTRVSYPTPVELTFMAAIAMHLMG